MKTKPGKVKSWKTDTVPLPQMVMRMVEVRAETADDASKSVEVVIASENPVERWDDQRGAMIQEVLLMDGVEFRTDRKQLPIVDSHDRSTVRNVLGSVRNVRVEGTQLVGTATFARDVDSQTAYEKLKDGHLTDFSITATPKDIQKIQRGEVYRTADREIEGPADIVSRWTPTDASLVAAGADETSTVRQLRRSYMFGGNDMIKRAMDEAVKTALVGKGMPEQIDDAESALTWVLGLLTPTEVETESESESPAEEVAMMEGEVKPEEVAMMDGEVKEEEIAKSVNRALAADRQRRREIVALCSKAKLERSFADALCESDCSLEIARQKVLEKLMTNPIGASAGRERISVTADGQEKFNNAMRDGLVTRAYQGAGVRNRKYEGGKPAEGFEDFQHMSLQRMAEKWLQRAGINTDRMSPKDIALAAIGSPSVMRRYNIQREAYHTSGSFANLMLDAANKTLIAAYDEAPYTWNLWARQGNSVPDFKAINRIRFSEAPDLEVVPEGRPYKEGTMSDQKESYKVEKYGAIFTVTWETVVNDDLDAISRIPAMHGNAARRKQNKKVYEVLTANPTMSDSVALFGSHASGTNLSGGAADPSVSTLNTAFAAMMKQKGLNSDVVLNIQPRYLIVPVALSATALQLVGSLADPGAGGSAAGNSNSLNIYGPNGVRPVQVVVEPTLDGNSATAWYLSADPSQIDTVELAFLQGEESPVLENEWDFDTDCYKYKVRQTFGVAAIDWRGLYKYAAS